MVRVRGSLSAGVGGGVSGVDVSPVGLVSTGVIFCSPLVCWFLS